MENNICIEIKELSPEYLDDFLYFFENVAHTDNKEWDRCYCLNYCSDDQSKIMNILSKIEFVL